MAGSGGKPGQSSEKIGNMALESWMSVLTLGLPSIEGKEESDADPPVAHQLGRLCCG